MPNHKVLRQWVDIDSDDDADDHNHIYDSMHNILKKHGRWRRTTVRPPAPPIPDEETPTTTTTTTTVRPHAPPIPDDKANDDHGSTLATDSSDDHRDEPLDGAEVI